MARPVYQFENLIITAKAQYVWTFAVFFIYVFAKQPNIRLNIRRRLKFRLKNGSKIAKHQAKHQAPPGIPPEKVPENAQTSG
ncbi:MAG: hypothetical protein K5881_01530 [Saccharofermentans sp.]|nr:hypothetical protein [Saccharofermentans sp.]